MQTRLRKHRHHQRQQSDDSHANAILANHVRGGVSRNRRDHVGGARMQVWGQHAAGRELEQRHAGPEARDGGERGGVGGTYGARRRVVVGVLCEVVGPVCGAGEQRRAVKGCGGGA